MPLSDEEKKRRKKESQKKWRESKKGRATMRRWLKENPEKKKSSDANDCRVPNGAVPACVLLSSPEHSIPNSACYLP